MKINYKRTTYILTFAFVLSLVVTVMVLAGSTDSPGSPTDAGSQMYTLEQIYQRLTNGTAATKMTTFTEPSSGPGSTMNTLDEIMGKAPALDDTNGAGLGDVTAGKTYWGLTSGEWGLQTGKGTGAPMTGQTSCWDSSGNSIVCAGTGQDGEYQLGHLPAFGSGNFVRFTDNGNGTVTDNLTQLIWLKNANCPNATRNWSTALSDVAQLNTNGTMNSNSCGDTSNSGSHQTDWRLPNANELYSLGDVPAWAPFTGVQSNNYWSSTTHEFNPAGAHVMNPDGGVANAASLKSGVWYVWSVRNGP